MSVERAITCVSLLLALAAATHAFQSNQAAQKIDACGNGDAKACLIAIYDSGEDKAKVNLCRSLYKLATGKELPSEEARTTINYTTREYDYANTPIQNDKEWLDKHAIEHRQIREEQIAQLKHDIAIALDRYRGTQKAEDMQRVNDLEDLLRRIKERP